MSYTLTHWGAYRPQLQGGRLVGLLPTEWDAAPSPIGQSMPAAQDAPYRVRRPAVRRSFLNPATRHCSGHLRGQEPFVELPWDEALDLVAHELHRVREQHGYVASQDSYSLGAGRVLMPHIVSPMDALLQSHTAWEVLEQHCELFVAFGGVPVRSTQVSPGGASDHRVGPALQRMAEAGRTRFVNISPARDDLDAVPQAEWIPIRPGTDTALMLALAHVLISEQQHDSAFLARCTVGFEVVRDYVLGVSDGVPKTPQWQAGLTGVPSDTALALARCMAASRTMVNCTYSLQRAVHGEQPFWMTVTLAALLGQIGLPGGGFGLGYGCMNYVGSGYGGFSGARLPQGRNAVSRFIPVARIVDMLLQPGQPFDYNGQRHHYPDIRLVYWAGGNFFHHHQDLNRALGAWRRPEAIITHEPFWTAQARRSDVVLPATTPLERDDIGSAGSERFMIAMKAAVPPVGEARDDYAIFSALAERLGFVADFTEGRTVGDWLHHLYEAARPRAEATGLDLPAFDAFWAGDVLELPRPDKPIVMLADFRADPEQHPLPTPSGRIELFSEKIAGFGLADCPGHATWLPQPPSDWPLHLLSHQPATRLHSQYDGGCVSQASKVAGREPLTLNRQDAEARGIADGDVVRVFNAQGAFLAGAVLSDGLLRGVVRIATGAWFDPLDPTQAGSLCKHGNPNLVAPDVGSSLLAQGCAAQSARVQVERWVDEAPPVTVFEGPGFELRPGSAESPQPRV